MLYKSGVNLKQNALEFIQGSSSITIISAYIKLSELMSLNDKNNISRIVVRWEIEDLIKGVSDLELYEYCVNNGITLYRNTRIHLKAIWDNESTIILGSANITGRGIGEIGNTYNYELSCKTAIETLEDFNYLNHIITTSEYVDIDLFTEIQKIVKSCVIPKIDFPKLPTVKKKIDFFLISQLPQTKTPEHFYFLFKNKLSLTLIEKQFFSHDMTLYCLEDCQDASLLLEKLKYNFNNHPFILSFKDAVRNAKYDKPERDYSMHFGRVTRWFSYNTTTVPTPRPYDLNEQISILYDWICFFDNSFTWSRPGGTSQVIKYNH
jgi:hypothetical protein